MPEYFTVSYCSIQSTHQDLDEEPHHMVVDSQEDSWESDGYMEESDNDLDIDDEVDEIVDFVFWVESDPEETLCSSYSS